MANRVIRSVIRFQSTTATSEPATLPRRGKAVAPRRYGYSTPYRPPAYFFPKGQPKIQPIKLPELPLFIEPPYDPVLIPPVPTFSLEQAKKHLIEADGRFERMFVELKCWPFERLKPVDPFRKLITYTLNQPTPRPVTKTVRDRFLRLFDRSLPEKITKGINYTFPSPGRLASVDENILMTTGLSKSKAESMLDIANRFIDRQLSIQKLTDASDEKLVEILEEILTDVRGFEKLTASKFAIFWLRRPDILPVGDLEIQKGLLNWVISSHEPDRYPLRMNLKKLPKTSEDDSVLPVPGEAPISTASVSSSSSEPPNDVLLIPKAPVQLPEGITLEMLKARADSIMAKGGRYLWPSEMGALTASWKPYRSLGVFYLETLMDVPK